MPSRVLVAGGYGALGSAIARHLRQASVDVEIVLAGRHPERGSRLAESLGATIVRLDLAEGCAVIDLAGADLVVVALPDPAGTLARAALTHGIAHVAIVTANPDASPIAAAAVRSPPCRPILLVGHGMAAVATIVARRLAVRFRTLDAVAITVIDDPRNPIGMMTARDAEGLVGRALLRDVRVEMAETPSLGSRGGRRASCDLYLDMTGVLWSGEAVRLHTAISDPRGAAHLTALGAAMAAERVLGLDGRPPAGAGLQLTEALLMPDAAISRLEQAGVRIFTGEAPVVPAPRPRFDRVRAKALA